MAAFGMLLVRSTARRTRSKKTLADRERGTHQRTFLKRTYVTLHFKRGPAAINFPSKDLKEKWIYILNKFTHHTLALCQEAY